MRLRGVGDVLFNGVKDGEWVVVECFGESFGLAVPFGFRQTGDDGSGFLQGVKAFFYAPAGGEWVMVLSPVLLYDRAILSAG